MVVVIYSLFTTNVDNYSVMNSVKKAIGFVAMLLVGGVIVYAAAPSGGYAPNATLDPDCAPGDVDCFVKFATSSLVASGTDLVYTDNTGGTNTIAGGAGGGFTSAEIDTSAELAGILTDETGTGNAVFSVSPTVTGTLDVEASDFSGTMTMSGVAANIALGSNYLSGDGADEGVFVSSTGNVGVGTASPGRLLNVDGIARLGVTGSNDGQLEFNHSNGVIWSFQKEGASSLQVTNNAGSAQNFVFSAPNGVNVGIGTTTPAVELDVHTGTINAAAICDEDNTNCIDLSVGVGGVTAINDLSDGINDGSSLFLGTNAGVNDDATTNANVGIGFGAMANTVSGANNNAVGYNALASNTAGNENNAFGYQALFSNTTGSNNNAVGQNSLYSNTTGNNNAAFGRNALFANTTGSGNTASGFNSLTDNTTGASNTAYGQDSLGNNTIGSSNVALGVSALVANTTGGANTALGFGSLFSSLSANNNAGIGGESLYSITSGDNNVAVGYRAGRFSSSAAELTSADNSVLVGYDTRPNASGETNQIVIGHGAVGLGSNTAVLGNDSIATTALKGNVGIGTTAPAAAFKLEIDTAQDAGTRMRVKNTSAGNSAFAGISGRAEDAAFEIGTYSTTYTATLAGLSLADAVMFTSNSSPAASRMILGTNSAAPLHLVTNATNQVTIDTSGNVGIGTAAPTAPLHIQPSGADYISALSNLSAVFQRDAATGDSNVVAILAGATAKAQIALGTSGTSNEEIGGGRIRYDNGTGVMDFMTEGNMPAMTMSDSKVYVGITPNAVADTTLEVEGTIKIADGGETCTATTEGAIKYNAATNKHQGCDGTSWNDLY